VLDSREAESERRWLVDLLVHESFIEGRSVEDCGKLVDDFAEDFED